MPICRPKCGTGAWEVSPYRGRHAGTEAFQLSCSGAYLLFSPDGVYRSAGMRPLSNEALRRTLVSSSPISHPDLYGPGVEELYALAFDRIRAAKPLMLFVSEASRRDFVGIFGSDFPLMQIVYPPIRAGVKRGNERAVRDIPAKYFLTVGSIGARKNQARAIEAFNASGLGKEGYAYVVCGGAEPGSEQVMKLAKADRRRHSSGICKRRRVEMALQECQRICAAQFAGRVSVCLPPRPSIRA